MEENEFGNDRFVVGVCVESFVCLKGRQSIYVIELSVWIKVLDLKVLYWGKVEIYTIQICEDVGLQNPETNWKGAISSHP